MKIVDIAESQIGIPETHKYNEWYYNRSVKGEEYAWCAVFISWCASMSNISKDIIPKTASVLSMLNFYKRKNQFHSSNYIPKQGDIVFFSTQTTRHIGIIYSATANEFITIEGNVGGKVVKCSYTRNFKNLDGFGSPEYRKEK